MHNQEIAAVNLHNEVTDLELWLLSHQDALAEDIIQVRMQIIQKRAQLGILRFKIRDNEFNYQTTKASR